MLDRVAAEDTEDRGRAVTRPVALVLGAGPGLGLASARAFARAGYDVALVGRREEALAQLAGQIGVDGVDVGWAAVDVADAAALTAAVQRFAAHTGRLDVLHHNVSVYRAGRLGDVTADDLLADVAAGVASLLTAVRAALPALRDSGGSVVVTGGGAADRPAADAITLGVQKAGLRSLLQAMAPDLAAQGVHAATLTVRGYLKEGTPFDPARVADAVLALAEQRHDDPDTWLPVHDFTGHDGSTAS
jgi:NADP-dependent 3-hydroxy acid dehydrogenase YdfG